MNLLIDDEVGVEEVDGVVDKKSVEVELGKEVLDVLLEDLDEVDEVDGGVEARAEGLVVVLQGGDHAEGQGFPALGVELVVVDNNVAAIVHWGVRLLEEGSALGDVGLELVEALAVLSVQSHLNESELVVDVAVGGLESN